MTAQNHMIFRFGEFSVQEGEFCLRRAGESIAVEPKAFRVLVYLLRNPQRLVAKDELLDAVWPDTAVSENSLTRSIALLRRLLGDDTREPRYIATVPTVGYRFVCPVNPPVDGAPRSIAAPGEETGAAASSARMRWRVGLGCSVLAVVAATLLVALTWPPSHRVPAGSPGVSPQRGISSELISMHGAASIPVISPDAREIAYVWNGENLAGDLYVQLIREDRRDERPLRLTRNDSGFLCCASWSPDGRELAYGRCDDHGGGVFTISALGGPPRRVADVKCLYGIAGSPVWSPDAQSLFITDQCTPGAATTLMRLSLITGAKHCLVLPRNGTTGDFQALLSPDKEKIAFIRFISGGVSDIFTLDLNTHAVRPVTQEREAIWAMMWTPDSRQLVFRSSRQGLAGLWRVSAQGGPVEQEVVYPGIGTLSADGRRLVYLSDQAETSFSPTVDTPTRIVRADLSAAGGHLTSLQDLVNLAGMVDSQQLSPDDTEVVFASNPVSSGGFGGEIWKSAIDGSNAMQMTKLGWHAGTPRWSPDGRQIVFDCHPAGRSQIFLMDADGRDQRALIADQADNVTPSWSHDGRFVYYSSNRTGGFQVWARELATGRDRQITRREGLGPVESYDGKTLFYSQLDGAGLWQVPAQGGPELRLTGAPHSGYWGYFAVTAYGIYLLDTEYKPRPMILFYNFATRKLNPVMLFPKKAIAQEPGMAASRDGKILLLAEEEDATSITMVDYR